MAKFLYANIIVHRSSLWSDIPDNVPDDGSPVQGRFRSVDAIWAFKEQFSKWASSGLANIKAGLDQWITN